MMNPRFSLEGKVALVTGGGTGIGRASALMMAEHGANLVLAGLDSAPLEATAREIKDLGRKALPITMDVTDKQQCRNAVNSAIDHFEHLDVLVNCVGGGQLKPIEQWSDDEWHALLDLNLGSVWQLSRIAAEPMLAQGSGAIVNISSAGGITAMPDSPIYGAAKAGVNSLTRSMAAAWTSRGVRVNAIACGAIRAPTLVDELNRLGIDVATMARINGSGRLGEPWEIASGVVFLASDAASFCSGQIILIDGGPKGPTD